MKNLFRVLLSLCLALTLTLGCVCMAEAEKPFAGTKLVVFNCYEYIDEAVIDMFEEETGAKVEYVNYTDNEEMYAKLDAGAVEYDVIVPSDYMIERLIAEDRLEPLNPDNIPNRENVLDSLRNPDYDPEEMYSVPYMWGTLGVLYNTTMVDEPITSWDALFCEGEPNRVFMMNSQRDTIAIGLKALGFSVNTREESELLAAQELLVGQKQDGIPAGYMLDEIKEKMVGGEAPMGIVYSGDALWAMTKNDDLAYVVPSEGSNIWIDGMCIPKGSPNKDCAEAFINFMCRDDIAQMNMEYIMYSSPIKAVAEQAASQDERIAAVMNPDEEILSRCEFFHDISDCDLYEQVWMEIRLAR